MIRESADIAILGAGFAGSLLALILKQMGRDPLLIERGTHPRFAIGESSTPLANLILEELCHTYDLPRLLPLTKYGRWQKRYAQLACGLKRGFSFFQHELGLPFQPASTHANELLVAASPADEVGDTHWFREDFDYFLIQEIQAAGIVYFDQANITAIEEDGKWHLRGNRDNESLEIDAAFLIDATGPAGVLSRALGITTDPVNIHTNSWSVYSHFTGVELWEDLLTEMGAYITDYPFRCDNAALHHVLADGWMWVLRFNNGVTSAGIVFDGEQQPAASSEPPESIWQRTLTGYPSIARQFARAQSVRPFTMTGRLQRRARQAAGHNWAMLPHAAYFLDPLFSAGIAHTMLGIERLARIFERATDEETLPKQLADYERALFEEVEFLDWLIHGCYRTFGRFELLAPWTMYYFAGAVQSEMRRRVGSYDDADRFLFSHHPPLRAAVKRGHDALVHLPNDAHAVHDFAAQLQQQVVQNIAAFNPAGFCDPAKNNMYPFV